MDTSPATRPTLLVVDDSPANVRLLGRILGEEYRILYATNGQDALDSVRSEQPDLVLLDIMMPGMDGFTVCEVLQKDEQTQDIPVILVTGSDDAEAESRGFACGAVDFIAKPINPPVVRARVKTHLNLKKQKDILAQANLALVKEIQERQRLENQLREQAEYDTLTGLPNRQLFQDRLQQTVLLGERNLGLFALLFIDLDRFKWVNDTLGHDAGDQLLVEAARRMKSVVRKSDTVARLGGDEFTIILSDIFHDSMAELVARKILENLVTPFHLKGQEVSISGSIGIAIFPSDGTTAEELTKNADSAMYQAKESGRNAFQFYSHEINQRAHRRMRLETELRHACQQGELFLDYQPKIKLATGQISGMEALLRWDHPREGILFPRQLIPLAEGTGLIHQIGEWVLFTACQEAADWSLQGFPGLKLAVNLSVLQFRDGDKLVQLVEEALAQSGFPAHLLELEITESIMMTHVDHVSGTLEKLQALGVTIAMDDFGVGYSSLALLKRLPVQTLKIDRSFVNDLSAHPESAVFIAAIVSMAQQLRLRVIVEGVETDEQLQMMKDQGDHDVQGYYFSPPLGKNAFLALLQGHIPLGGFRSSDYSAPTNS
ncbi:MAG: EAL domain-containing protein [Magnetococcales bacterium]|nr:EAL domain-containing protein [Magnetococcales bacterium]